MRSSTARLLRRTALVALLLAARPAAAEVLFGGNLGLSLNREDSWAEGISVGRTRYWFTGGLHLDASFFSPGTLTLGGAASYLGYRAAGGSASDAFNYQLQLNALSRTPVSVSASANRQTVDFTADRDGGRVGSTVSDGVGGTVVMQFPDYPIVSTTVRNVATTNRSAGAPEVKSEVTSITAEAAQSLHELNYSVSYGTDRSSGDYAESNYRNHTAMVRAQAQVATNVSAQVAASYNLREPTLVNPLNPRLDNQALSAWATWYSPEGNSGGGGYSYSNSIFDTPGSALRQSINHTLTAYGTRRLSPRFSFDLSAAGSSARTLVGTAEQQATGEQVGATLRWAGPLGAYATQASINGNVGLLQPAEGGNTSAWGLGATASTSRNIATWSGSANLSGTYDRNTSARAGERTRLLASLGATGYPRGWYVNSLLTGGYSHATSPAFGTSSQVNVRFESQAARSGYNLSLSAGITDDLAEALVPGAAPATPLVPVSFNTSSRYAMATATLPVVTRLSLLFAARHVSLSAPGRADQFENGFSVNAMYAIGAFQLSLYDQYTVSGSSGFSSGTQNLLFFSITRTFGR